MTSSTVISNLRTSYLNHLKILIRSNLLISDRPNMHIRIKITSMSYVVLATTKHLKSSNVTMAKSVISGQ